MKRQTGVGMIEVLITLFILSIGLLGVASMQFIGSFSNKDALSRTQAVMVAQQMSERLRASVVPSLSSDGFVVSNQYFEANNYNFSGLACPGNNPFQCFCLAIPAAVTDCQANTCTADQIAQFDAYQMSCAAVESNPNATISVTCDDKIAGDGDACSAGSIHSIVVSWPSVGWRDGAAGSARVENANCNAGGATGNDCVILQVGL
ncbi:type IV pilus modification protein PilV [Glaciecola siphonariae]|uniref:Type IV pilus modification protein PilV n=1 Tax=Glaciecola siphonariae TaxID=521012 RepID=A0ABV9LZ49_9ALTE